MPEKSILIADDDPSMVEFLTSALEVVDFQIDSVTSTEELVEKLLTSTPDLIILDMGIPGLDEKKPAMDVRKRTSTLAKILIISGRQIDDERKAGHLQGAQEAIQKGAGMAPIIATVQAMLQ